MLLEGAVTPPWVTFAESDGSHDRHTPFNQRVHQAAALVRLPSRWPMLLEGSVTPARVTQRETSRRLVRLPSRWPTLLEGAVTPPWVTFAESDGSHDRHTPFNQRVNQARRPGSPAVPVADVPRGIRDTRRVSPTVKQARRPGSQSLPQIPVSRRGAAITRAGFGDVTVNAKCVRDFAAVCRGLS